MRCRKAFLICQTRKVMDIVIYLVKLNATGKPSHVYVALNFKANACGVAVKVSFKRGLTMDLIGPITTPMSCS